jgi:hypothetical protein
MSDLRSIIRIKSMADAAAGTTDPNHWPMQQEGEELVGAYQRLRAEARAISMRAGWSETGEEFDAEMPPLEGVSDPGPPLGVHFDDYSPDPSVDPASQGVHARFRLRQLSAWAAGHQEAFELEAQMEANARVKAAEAVAAARAPLGFGPSSS